MGETPDELQEDPVQETSTPEGTEGLQDPQAVQALPPDNQDIQGATTEQNLQPPQESREKALVNEAPAILDALDNRQSRIRSVKIDGLKFENLPLATEINRANPNGGEPLRNAEFIVEDKKAGLKLGLYLNNGITVQVLEPSSSNVPGVFNIETELAEMESRLGRETTSNIIDMVARSFKAIARMDEEWLQSGNSTIGSIRRRVRERWRGSTPQPDERLGGSESLAA